MKMAILIQCHAKADQINKIIEFFDDDNIDIYIHIDKKSNIISKININSNTHILNESIDVRWGRFSQVEANIAMFKEVAKSNKKYKYVHLISGHDYPIKDLSYIKDFFKNADKQFVDYIKLPNKCLVKDGNDRYKVYYPQWIIDRPKCLWKRIVRVLYREIVLATKIFERNLENIPEVYYGSQWMSITSECMNYILDYIKTNNEYYNFFKNSIYSDEMFFQTIILNSHFKESINNNNLRYIDWSANLESPKSLENADIDLAIASNNIFARKIDQVKIIDYINEKLLRGN